MSQTLKFNVKRYNIYRNGALVAIFNRKTKNVANKDKFHITRQLYPFESMFEFLCTTLSGGAFLAKVSMTLGVRDSITALISSIASLVCIVQLFSGSLAKRTPIKKWLLPLTLFTRVCMMGIFLLPFLNISSFVDVILLILVFSAQSSHILVYPIKQTMFLTTVPEEDRTGYLARHNRVSIIAGIPLVLFGGLFIDKMTELGKLRDAFLIIAVAILFFGICNLVILIISREPPMKIAENKNMLQDLGTVFKSEKFRILFILAVVFGCGVGIFSPFVSTYVQREQGFSLTVANLFTVAMYIAQILLLSALNKFKHKFNPAVLRTIFFAGNIVSNGVFFIMNNDTAIFFHSVYVIVAAITGTCTVGYTVLIYDSVEEEQRTTAVGILELTKGISAFLTTLCISPVFDRMQTNGVTLFGKPIFAQRILALCATGIITVAFIIWMCNRKKFSNIEKA